MATAVKPAAKRRSRFGRWPLMIIGLIVVLVVGGVGLALLRGGTAPAPGLPAGWTVVTAETGMIDSTVSATGNVEPQAEAALRFAGSGTITEVLVKPGDTVAAGQPLARIDTANLVLALQQSEADLAQAQADLADLLDGATEQEIAEARARVAQAQSQYQQAASSVTAADIAAARAELEQARARLARLEAGPANDELASNAAAIERARSGLEQARAQLSAAKERARLDMEARANALRNAQDEYSRIYWDNRRLDKLPGDLPQELKDKEAQALRAVQDAEAALESARVAYEQARQDEITTLRTREAELASAQAASDKLLAGPRAEDLAEARAAVQRAQARIAQLTGANRSSDLSAQQANIEIAKSNLDALLADPSASQLARAEAAVTRAEVALKQARRNLDLATLTAPFAATVARVDMRVGEQAQADAIIVIADLSSFHVDVPVDELDVAQLQVGQPVRISVDALPGEELSGRVTNIAPLATRSNQGTTNYEVTVTLDASSTAVRSGMTAVVQIVTSQKDNAVLVPRRAVQAEGGKSYVLIPREGQPASPTGQPASERRAVTLGLSNSETVEIVSGLEAGEQVLVQDVVSTFNPAQ